MAGPTVMPRWYGGPFVRTAIYSRWSTAPASFMIRMFG